jgi:glycosyltransferase involved in cell wall biosynthesis
MRILQLSPQVPYPLSDGGKVGIFNITKQLSLRGHDITFLCLDRPPRGQAINMTRFAHTIAVPHSNKNSILGIVRNLFSNLPYNLSKYHSRAYTKALRRVLTNETFDVVHVDHLHMAHYGLLCRQIARIPIVLREHNVESTIMERYAETKRNKLWRTYLGAQLSRIRRYEGMMAQQYDACCVITETDKLRLLELAPRAKTTVVPGGVDPAFFSGAMPTIPTTNSISFFGGLDWLPNQDAVRWFLDQVFPLITKVRPTVRFVVIGKNPPPDLVARQNGQITMRGYVDNIKDEAQRYCVTIAPFRIGGGMRLKILESFAMRIPVVSTSIGYEGIEATPGVHLLAGDDPGQFATSVLALLDDPDLRRRITEKAYALAWNRYRWESVAEQFEHCYEDVIHSQVHGRISAS